MTWLDYGVIAVLLLSIAWGAWRGLVHEVLSLAGWIMAFVAANLLAAPLSESFPANMRPEFRVVAAFLVIFIAVLVLTTLLSALVTKFVRVSVLQSLDRWLGALFGRRVKETVRKEIIIVVTPHLVPEDPRTFSYVIPQASDIFDSFGRQLLYNAYRIRPQDVYDLDFLFVSRAYRSLLECAGRYAEIKAEIEALRLHRRLQQPLRV